ncbi:hypothetical protein [Burkholderia pseudomallei]|uniref:hypothetical protein n=1 Tax=Burkholderia pseudomallei TaxID=28450 RepID=UPI0012F4BA4A|nr:hypothetical protein [Burkholderia pseudomallei]
MSNLLSLFDEQTLDGLEVLCAGKLAMLLDEAHSVARGVSTAIRVARDSSVQRELDGTGLCSNDVDALLALAGFAVSTLEERIEALTDEACTIGGGA